MNGGVSADELSLARDFAERRTEDGALGDALASLLNHLRGQPYGRFYGRPEEALRDEADRFVGRLAKHFRGAEESLFPALQEVEPGSVLDIEELRKDHRLLHLYARDLALLILGNDNEGACGIARSFLAVLLGHICRETKGVDRFVRSMDVSAARRLSAAIAVGRRPGDGNESLKR